MDRQRMSQESAAWAHTILFCQNHVLDFWTWYKLPLPRTKKRSWVLMSDDVAAKSREKDKSRIERKTGLPVTLDSFLEQATMP